MTWTFYFNITLHKGKKTQQVFFLFFLLEELFSQPNTYQTPQAPSWLCHHQLLLGEQGQKICPSGSTGFQTELGKIQLGSASHERNSSICTSFRGTGRDRAGLRAAARPGSAQGKESPPHQGHCLLHFQPNSLQLKISSKNNQPD